jgi:transposase
MLPSSTSIRLLIFPALPGADVRDEKGERVDVIHPRCAGVDVSKRDAKVCVRIAGAGRAKATSTVTTWGAVTNQVLALRDHLIAEQVTLVVMEATSDYWKPFFYLLEDGPFEVLLVNARHVKNLPGRKTDVSDAAWLAQLGAHGLVRGSFVPPEPIRQLRDLTRTRTTITRERGREIQRLEKLLEDAGIKLSSVASDITGVSGRAMLEALIDGQRDPAALADLAKRRLRSKIPALTELLTGRFGDHHAFLARLHLDLIDQHTMAIVELSARIEVVIEPFRGARDLIVTIPGISTAVADVIIAETGADMDRFPSAGHLASWAGTCPGSNESAGRIKSTQTRPGNPYLKGALGVAAMSAARSRGTYLSAKYRRIAARRGPIKAIVAVEHAMLIAIWNMLSTGAFYCDPGDDYYARLNPDKAKNRAIDQLRRMGYAVTLNPLADAG